MIEFEQYRREVNHLGWGKVLPKATYCLWDQNGDDFPPGLRDILCNRMPLWEARKLGLVKFHRSEFVVSLLHYPGFWSEAHPVLARSFIRHFPDMLEQDLDYRDRANPPILHRKELFLPKGHPRWDEFSALTTQEEQLGLYEGPVRIGTLRGWQAMLDAKNAEIVYTARIKS